MITRDEFNEFKNKFKENKIPKIGDLLRKSRYYLINVHPIGQYSDTKMSERIVNIGGIEGEMEDFIRKNKDSERKHVVTESSNTSQLSGDFPRSKEEEDWIYEADCVILFSMSTEIYFTGFTDAHYFTLQETFTNSDCKYIIKVTNSFSPFKQLKPGEHFYENDRTIIFYNGMIREQEILEKAQVKLFVTDGGQNTFNEILKAGVPMIIIPFFGDQPFNATLAEYLGIGISIRF
uniref:glucuronosyltransferase n=1 Tax=Meloidogyne javanica TaxID=6303 RepID=A0A915LS43_MELJA